MLSSWSLRADTTSITSVKDLRGQKTTLGETGDPLELERDWKLWRETSRETSQPGAYFTKPGFGIKPGFINYPGLTHSLPYSCYHMFFWWSSLPSRVFTSLFIYQLLLLLFFFFNWFFFFLPTSYSMSKHAGGRGGSRRGSKFKKKWKK